MVGLAPAQHLSRGIPSRNRKAAGRGFCWRRFDSGSIRSAERADFAAGRSAADSFDERAAIDLWNGAFYRAGQGFVSGVGQEALRLRDFLAPCVGGNAGAKEDG